MEVIKTLWYRLGALWLTVASSLEGFWDELIFRVSLAFDVLVGRTPQTLERRTWNRATETPALIDVLDWSTDRRIFSVLVWPSLESSPHDADYVFHRRVDEVKEVIARGAADMVWSTCLETDYGLTWDSQRKVWVGQDGAAYDGSRFDKLRNPDAA